MVCCHVIVWTTMVELFGGGVIVVSGFNLGFLLMNGKLQLISDDPGMAVTTSICLIGIGVCLIAIAKLLRRHHGTGNPDGGQQAD